MAMDEPKLPRSPISFKTGAGSRVMDFRPSSGLAAGLKRVGGRSGTSRLGKSPISTESKHGRIKISHKY